ncbi:MAG TPA: amylo-alpha-1,6-glucosidase [Planctomycetaceae bacterium]|nr:amylo-alpha-1,6-glucosidase [Planctomycetaceae bacterium]
MTATTPGISRARAATQTSAEPAIVRRVEHDTQDGLDHQQLLTREWLVTNGLGGYASGTIAGVATRRYHGLLVAALPAPFGRRVLFSHLSERLRLADGRTIDLSGQERACDALDRYGADWLSEFRLEDGLPVWSYETNGLALEKRVLMPYGQNTVHISYRLLSGAGPLRLKLLPSVHFRPHEDPVTTPLPGSFRLSVTEDRYEVFAGPDLPPLRLLLHGECGAFTIERRVLREVLYRVERRRGYQSEGELWSPGYFRVNLSRDRDATFVASTEPWEEILALSPEDARRTEANRRTRLLAAAHPAARDGVPAELVLAADQFLIEPAGRVADSARAQAAGDEARTIIAGYHWFTDWGRDTMISLEGLTLLTGREADAGYILRTFAHYVRDGLIPNMFPEGENDGLYHTADATLWFFHALDRYVEATDDRLTLRQLLPRLEDIVTHHLRGTRFGIGVDPGDGLLRQGAEGCQLTWMDAKVGDWVVTPRRGKAVEINALWYNALCLLSEWLREEAETAPVGRSSTPSAPGPAARSSPPSTPEETAERIAAHAAQVRASFNQRFWYADGGYLYDVVDGPDGDDAACRPNQLFAVSLRHAVLDRSRWKSVLGTVQERLLTPMGPRSLAPGHADYKPIYSGDIRARDAAYHQGTVWPWLIGPFIDAWLKVHPGEIETARAFLEGFADHLGEACIGTISEIFDAEAPYTPRGCIAQAWSVAELLRAWIKTEPRDVTELE